MNIPLSEKSETGKVSAGKQIRNKDPDKILTRHSLKHEYISVCINRLIAGLFTRHDPQRRRNKY
jgi:hypothetical protein